MIGGLLTIAAGLALKYMGGSDDGSFAALILLFCGALLWSIAALAFAAIREDPGATERGPNALKEAEAGRPARTGQTGGAAARALDSSVHPHVRFAAGSQVSGTPPAPATVHRGSGQKT